jgi:hypothetical protein
MHQSLAGLPQTPEAFAAALGTSALRVRLPYDRPDRNALVHGELVAVYQYTNAEGSNLFENQRWLIRCKPSRELIKSFFWRRWDVSSAQWVWGLEQSELVPYRLPSLLAAIRSKVPVFVVEGEKDVHSLEAVGLVATTAPLGALQWLESFAEWMREARVIVIPDNDHLGHLHAARIALSLRDVAASITVIRLPGIGAHGDVTSWFEAGHNVADLHQVVTTANGNPSEAQVRDILGIPPHCAVASSDPAVIHAMVDAMNVFLSPTRRGPFALTQQRFLNVGVALDDAGSALETRARIITLVRASEEPIRSLLADGSLLERRVVELSALGAFAMAADAAAGEGDSADFDAAESAFVRAAGARVLHSVWDWNHDGVGVPSKTGASHLLRLMHGNQVHWMPITTLPALIIGACARPQSLKSLLQVVQQHLDPSDATGAVLERIREQVGELCTSGILRAVVADPVARLETQVRRVLLGEESLSRPEDATARITRLFLSVAEAVEGRGTSLENSLSLMMLLEALGPARALYADVVPPKTWPAPAELFPALRGMCASLAFALEPSPGMLSALSLGEPVGR